MKSRQLLESQSAAASESRLFSPLLDKKQVVIVLLLHVALLLLMLAPPALSGPPVLWPVLVGVVRGLVRLLGFGGAKGRGGSGASGKVLILSMAPVVLPVLLTLSVGPARCFLSGFFLFLRPPCVSAGGLARLHVMVGPLICCFRMRPLELLREIPIFLEFWKI